MAINGKDDDGRGRADWNTTVVFLIMIALTGMMILGVKALVTGSVRSPERIEIRAEK